ncbi:hypothetical protein [Streptomyces sp. NPDC005322]
MSERSVQPCGCGGARVFEAVRPGEPAKPGQHFDKNGQPSECPNR